MIKFYDRLLTLLTPIIIFTGKIYMPFSRKKIKGSHYYKWRDSIEIGTVILTKTRGEFSNLINPIELKHAGIYVGRVLGDEICYVLEAVGKGVKLTDLVTFLTTKDVAVGCKPTFIRNEEEFKESILVAVDSFSGLPYDYLFNEDGKAFYCFELCAKSLTYAYPEMQLKCKEIIKNKKIYDHNTFLDKRFFKVIFDSRD